MNIVAISDTHSMHNTLTDCTPSKMPEADTFIFAGDMCGRSTSNEISNFISWVERLPYKNKIIVAGNHDIPLEYKDHGIKKQCADIGIHYLQDESVEIEGITFYGSPYTPMFYDWAFMKYDEELIPIWDKIPQETNVLITHGPPYRILDRNTRGEFCGSVSLFRKIKKLSNLKHHIFGHIHEDYGTEKNNNVIHHNVSICNINYKPVNKPSLFSY